MLMYLFQSPLVQFSGLVKLFILVFFDFKSNSIFFTKDAFRKGDETSRTFDN